MRSLGVRGATQLDGRVVIIAHLTADPAEIRHMLRAFSLFVPKVALEAADVPGGS